MINKTFKKLGYRKIKVQGLKFIVKKLTPLDFLDSDGIPFSLFSVDNPATVYGQVWGQIKTKDKKKKKKTEQMILIKQVLDKGVVRFPKDTTKEDYVQPDTLEIGIKLYGAILSNTLKAFLRPFVISKQQLLYWDKLANRYGKLPIDCLIPSGNYSAVDSFIFNSFVLNTAIKEESRIAKQKAKKG